MGGTDHVLRRRARGVSLVSRSRARRQLPTVRSGAQDVQLVGLSPARVSEELRLAHRPHPALNAAHRPLLVVPHRPQRAQGTNALRPRTDTGRTTRRLTRGNMVFASPLFLFLFLCPSRSPPTLWYRAGRNGVLLAASVVFYAWGEAKYLALVLGSVAF